jgi:metal-responsive CopG/Arc/MetJ family transcriptional regulator
MPRKPSGNILKITLLITPALHAELGKAATEENTNGSELLRRLIKEYLATREKASK